MHASTNASVKRTIIQASVTSETRATKRLQVYYTLPGFVQRILTFQLRLKRSKRMSKHRKTIILKVRHRRITLV